MNTETIDASWYSLLVRPSWAPPAWLFGPVWSVLYTIIAITFGYVLYLYFTKKISHSAVAPFILNFIFNISFTPIQFGLKNNLLASLDIILTLATLVWLIISSYRLGKKNKGLSNLVWVAYANIPYLLWVTFATALQLTITYLNL